ncbi:hypothetical protein [Rhabdothermincola salaria]|uniref:hypothetical protein n=1 Tax=Rhabdothermincola salaria TaxID=2903142 RepID=UPI001E2CB1DE|nr:hypothetical protein [Rhabdothermincola salaria]MCD9624352.1 hypothetical protein [Rhabdothermincola salaria]
MAATSPRTVSRRAVLRGTATGAVLLAATPALPLLAGCGSLGFGTDTDPLRTLGASLRDGPEGPRLAASGLPGVARPITDEATLFEVLDLVDDRVDADFAAGRTVLGDGWLLADTEAIALVAYARS